MKNKEIVNILKSEKSYDEKINKTLKYIKKETLQIWAVECAESVLYIFENKYPNDKNVRECIEATKDYIDNLITKDELIKKRDAAYVTYATYYATYATYYATCAAYTAYAAYAAYAARAASCAAPNQQDQQDINLSLLISLIENEEN